MKINDNYEKKNSSNKSASKEIRVNNSSGKDKKQQKTKSLLQFYD